MPVSPMHVGYLMLLRKAICKKQKYFVRRLKNNQIFKILEERQCCLVAEKSVLGSRVIAFC
jgi:hemolysin-activating ACP:hemolysin acyltransferase